VQQLVEDLNARSRPQPVAVTTGAALPQQAVTPFGAQPQAVNQAPAALQPAPYQAAPYPAAPYQPATVQPVPFQPTSLQPASQQPAIVPIQAPPLVPIQPR
jgi:hypothetical protein